MVHLLVDKLNSLLRAITVEICQASTSTDLKKCQYKDKGNQRRNKNLSVGHEVGEFVGSHTLSSKQLDGFITAVRTYFRCRRNE